MLSGATQIDAANPGHMVGSELQQQPGVIQCWATFLWCPQPWTSQLSKLQSSFQLQLWYMETVSPPLDRKGSFIVWIALVQAIVPQSLYY